VFVGQEELFFGRTLGLAEMYKIHGTYEHPDSLIITRRDYDSSAENNPYLGAKLTTLSVEHPIVFLGDSLSDANILPILSAILGGLRTRERVQQLATRLIFVEWDELANDTTMAHVVIPVRGHHLPVVSLRTRDLAGLYSSLGRLRRRFPAKLLRQLKDTVYDLVLRREPGGQLYVEPLDPAQDPREVDVVFGVGASRRLSSVGQLTEAVSSPQGVCNSRRMEPEQLSEISERLRAAADSTRMPPEELDHLLAALPYIGGDLTDVAVAVSDREDGWERSASAYVFGYSGDFVVVGRKGSQSTWGATVDTYPIESISKASIRSDRGGLFVTFDTLEHEKGTPLSFRVPLHVAETATWAFALASRLRLPLPVQPT
jgi:hypothetical protein